MGDIVLIRSDGSPKDIGIELLQVASFNRATRAGSAYVHAAVYAGDDQIVDITGAGVAKRSIWHYCSKQSIAVRRLPGLSASQRAAVVREAELLLGQPYAWGWLALSKLIPQTISKPDDLFCSTFVSLAMERGSGKQLDAQSFYRPLYPGTLAHHQSLDDVWLEWRPVA